MSISQSFSSSPTHQFKKNCIEKLLTFAELTGSQTWRTRHGEFETNTIALVSITLLAIAEYTAIHKINSN